MSISTLLAAVFAVVAATSDGAGEVTVKLDVTKAGELRWSDGPCAAEARGTSGEVVATDQRGESLTLPKGNPVVVVVSCTAKEGTVRRSQRIAARKDETLKLTLSPATIIASIDKDGTRSAGVVVVYDGNDVEVARGADRTALLVEPGRVRVVGLVDRGGKQPIRGEQSVVVKSGVKSEPVIDASDGMLIVTVTDNGKPAKAVVALREPGQVNRSLELIVGTATAVPSGTWDIVTQLEDSHDFREQLTRGVVVSPRKTTTKVIGHSTGTLTPTTTPATGVLVELLHPGADVAFNQLEVGVPARLSPGKYIVRATGEGALDDGARPVVNVTHTVGAGSAAKLSLHPAIALVDVEVRIGGEPAVLPVSLTLTGADAAFVTKSSAANGLASFVVAPQKLTVTTSLATPHGALELTKQVALSTGKNRVRLDFNVGSAIVQVIDGGAAVVADVAYFQRLKNGQPTGEPVVAVKAGEEARLAPGIYVLAVTRKGEQRLFGEAKIAAGRTLERALDWSPAAPLETAPAPTTKKATTTTTTTTTP